MSKPKPWRDIENWSNVRSQLRELLDLAEDSPANFLENAGLNRDLYYKLKHSETKSKPMRPSTIQKLSEALNIPYAYIGSHLFFGNIHLISRDGTDMKDLLKDETEMSMPIDILAYKIGISTHDLSSMTKPNYNKTSIPVSMFQKISHALDMRLKPYPDYSVGLIDDSNSEIGRFDSIVHVKNLNITAVREQQHAIDIGDDGLRELLAEDNLSKYSITSLEIDMLMYIESQKDSKASISQWVAVLYAIRALDY